MNKLIVQLLMLTYLSPLLAAPNVVLQTISLGYSVSQSFIVNVKFSEPVVGLSINKVNITNGTVTNITLNNYEPTAVMTIKPKMAGNIKIFIPANSVVSRDSGVDNLASNTLNIVALDPSLRPSGNFNLTQWILTLPLPIGSRGKAQSISQTTLQGTPALNNGYTRKPYFYTDPLTGGMNFTVPLNGSTTAGSSFARSELAENLLGGVARWKLSDFAINQLTASLLVTHVPPIEKRFIIGQIHDNGGTDKFGNSGSKSPLLKLYYDSNSVDPNNDPCNGCIYGQVRTRPSQANFLKIINLVNNIPLNTLFTYKFTLLQNGTLTITVNNTSTVILLNNSVNNNIGWGAQQLYFKAGAYNLEHDSVEGGADSFYYLQATHL